MRTLSLIIMALILGNAQAAGQVYKVTDEEGNVTYTDNPPAEEQRGETVKVPEVNTQPAPEVRSPPRSQSEEDSEQTGYEAVYIAQPSHEQTIPPGQVEVPVQIVTEPALKQNHRLQVLYDGEPYGQPSAATPVLTGLHRGTHQIQAQVLDSDNRVVATSETVTIYIKRHSIQHPNPAPYPGSN